MEQHLFPHDTIRPIQQELTEAVQHAIASKKHLVAHAPTGLGKTAATLAPALACAKQHNLTIFFLTSRHTQHLIALKTLEAIKKKYAIPVAAYSFVGKKWMCAQDGVSTLPSSDFTDYCKSLVENDTCAFYHNARRDTKAGTNMAPVVGALMDESPASSEKIVILSKESMLCPYEVALVLANKAEVIICDYFYIFNENIRSSFFSKIGKQLENSILIIDEGHNLPARLRDALSVRISTFSIMRAIKEAKNNEEKDALQVVVEVQEVLNTLSEKLHPGDERMVGSGEFINALARYRSPHEMLVCLDSAATNIRSKKKQSSIGALAEFISSWPNGDEGFVRILRVEMKGNTILTTLTKRCLDPGMLTAPVLDLCHSTILMSGTLTPTAMYADLLGYSPERTIQHVFPSPFPHANKRCLIVPYTTTKYTERNEEQYAAIGKACADFVNTIQGCSAIFFPSYALLRSVKRYFEDLCTKTTFEESSRTTKEEKQDLLHRFASYKSIGAVLLGVASGSFGEGIDLPGVLKGVLVVGVPLGRPDLETKALINYYQNKFGKGMEYGYTLPAITKCLQNAGRCIRSEKDRGVLMFLDERYAEQRYRKCFPADWEIKITKDFIGEIKEFFGLF